MVKESGGEQQYRWCCVQTRVRHHECVQRCVPSVHLQTRFSLADKREENRELFCLCCTTSIAWCCLDGFFKLALQQPNKRILGA
jgi:hypothetical protein